ncbi:hypothetical protein [Lentimicrobium sp. S6]|uniref:hypothetical protein n=1 Tax=Lentimicrobium sp. S6 TaxID=2735872 RepID=UPI0015565334|nr:hypothetical protein [Lentimicrobium sp. S6]NPD46240.1 hypothetical protein [Lentimicrobium sp. S6]
MKKKIIYALAVLLMIITAPTYAQLTDPGEPDGGVGDHDPVGGGAPIGSGLALVIGLGLAYGTKKTYQVTKEEE